MKNLLLALVIVLSLPAALRAQEEDPAVAQLRDQLRKVLGQLRTAQGEIANLQAIKIQDDAKIADLEKRLDRTTKQGAADKAEADATIAKLQEETAAQDARNAKQVEALANWKKSYDRLLGQAKEIDAERKDLAAKKVLADRRIAELQVKNDELYRLGTQILHRYERYGLGDAILNREPFTGVAKVKFQNYVQENADRLADNRASSVAPGTEPATTTAATNATDR